MLWIVPTYIEVLCGEFEGYRGYIQAGVSHTNSKHVRIYGKGHEVVTKIKMDDLRIIYPDRRLV